jgi:GNAT superfamily N-acetyltransferase
MPHAEEHFRDRDAFPIGTDAPPVSGRYHLKPGDLGTIIHLHGTIYAKEYGFDETFEAYVAGPMAEFARSHTDRDRIWVAERGDKIVGCIAIVSASASDAQLRWFLVDPSARGIGLGQHLLRESIAFSREYGYERVFLWTVSPLVAAARLYQSVGFQKTEEKTGRCWGVDLVEEKYVLQLESELGRESTKHKKTLPARRRQKGSFEERG